MTSIDVLVPPLETTQPEPACWAVDPEVFYGPADSTDDGPPSHDWERRALAVCAGCRVLPACRSAALEFPAGEQYGVVGGMTAGQRRARSRRPRYAAAAGVRPGGRAPAPGGRATAVATR